MDQSAASLVADISNAMIKLLRQVHHQPLLYFLESILATRTVTHITDDIDDSTEGVETVTFGLFGATYEVDLSKDNQKALEGALEPFLNVARKAGGQTRRTGRSSSAPSNGASNGSGVDAKAVRAWAAANNVEVSPRGRINAKVLEQYHAANN